MAAASTCAGRSTRTTTPTGSTPRSATRSSTQQFARAKHMGLNCLRTHIKIADPRYYDAADRAGHPHLDRASQLAGADRRAKRRAYDTLVGMVERDWNHPSIVIWTIVNENWGTDLAVNADHRAWLVDMYSELKRLDPHRLVVGNSPCFTNFHVVTDIEDFHNYYGMPDHSSTVAGVGPAFAARPPWTFAREYAGIESWREYRPRSLEPAARSCGTRRSAAAATSRSSCPSSATGGCPTSHGCEKRYGGGALVVRDRDRVGRRRDVSPRRRTALSRVPPRQGVSHTLRPDHRQPADAVRGPEVSDRADAAPPERSSATSSPSLPTFTGRPTGCSICAAIPRPTTTSSAR